MNKCQFCGADIKISRKGNKYCSNICWEKEPYKSEKILDEIGEECMIDTEHSDWGDR